MLSFVWLLVLQSLKRMMADNYSLINGTLVGDGRAVDAAMATVYALICAAGLIGHGLVLLVIVDRHRSTETWPPSVCDVLLNHKR